MEKRFILMLGAAIWFLSASHSAVAWVCHNSCWDQTRCIPTNVPYCERVRGSFGLPGLRCGTRTVPICSPLPVSNQQYARCMGWKVLSCAGVEIEQGPTHGRYCGGKRVGPGNPVDALDKACRVHDDCVNQNNGNPSRMCACDGTLAAKATASAAAPGMSSGARERALIIGSLFAHFVSPAVSNPPICAIWSDRLSN